MAFFDQNPSNRRKNRRSNESWEEEGTRYRTAGRSGRRTEEAQEETRGGSRKRGYNGAGEHNPNRKTFKPEPVRGRGGPKPGRSTTAPGRRRKMEEAPLEQRPAYMDHEYVAPPARSESRRAPEPAEKAPVAENLLAGRNPIREAIKNGRDIEKLLVMRGELSGSARQIVQMAREARIPVQEVEKERLDEITPHHQGMLAFASAYQYATLEDMLRDAEEKHEDPFLIILDGITDPQNLGAVIRTAECVGAHGVIVRERRSVGLTPAAVKASAGAVEYIRVARVTNITRTLEELKKRGIWVYAVTMGGEDYRTVSFEGGTALVIGSEGEGISRLILEHCDQQVSLPMRGHLDSLNASAAASVMMYRVLAARDA